MRENNAHKLKPLRQELRINGTMHEACLWTILKNRQLGGVRFRRQFSVGPYVMDFYCPELRLCIELDGASHFTQEGLELDERRTAYLNGSGIKVIRFENCDLFEQQTAVIETIKYEIEQRKKMMEKYNNK